jgi:hypothetical protein
MADKKKSAAVHYSDGVVTLDRAVAMERLRASHAEDLQIRRATSASSPPEPAPAVKTDKT